MEAVFEPTLKIDNQILYQHDYLEGMLINPQDLNKAMIVFSIKLDKTYTLHIYKLQLLDGNQYGNEQLIATKTFTTKTSMEYFIKTFSRYNSQEFDDFLRKHDK
ncbi:hypothetical protein [Pseudoneobacillus sp. C159]